MDTILSVLTEHFQGKGRTDTRFVFPSQTSAFFWARKVLALFDIKTLAMERFLAWDRFKESCIRAGIPGLKPANAVHRALFAVNLAERNAELRLFSNLIPQKYSDDGTIFARNIARALPPLPLWLETVKAKTERNAEIQPDGEDLDFLTLENEYKQFLEKHKLFESAWERPPFREKENQYFIFYPELIEDFTEYEKLLDSPNIHIIRVNKNTEVKRLHQFDSSRAEIRAVILEIRRLYEQEKIPYEDMAISVPALETLEPYIKREAALYGVPVHPRSGRPLSRYSVGGFFSLAKECVDNNFSFSALKALLLNGSLPWRSPEKNEDLIRFGIENNCVSGYREDGRLKDVWEEAFNAEKSKLHPYYKDIKYKLCSLVHAKSFAEIRKYYFAFRGNWDDPCGSSLFLQDACSDESYDVIARCIEELSALIQIQESIPDVKISGVLSFFIDILNEKQYVPEREEGGVNIFQYRVAAAAPFAAHFVINANQKDSSVIYRSLKFLRPDKRKKTGAAEDDYDASPDLFRAYNSSDFVWYSASLLTFSGWTIPHSFFNDNYEQVNPEENISADYYLEEKSWWLNGANPFPARLFPAQKNGFEFWKEIPASPLFSLLKEPFTAARENTFGLLRPAIDEKRCPDGKLRVSATDLQVFFGCPTAWLFENIFEIKEEFLEARLLDDRSKGILFHEILRKLFERIKTEDNVFLQKNIEKYKDWAALYTAQVVAENKAFHGPLCAPLTGAMKNGIQRYITELLKLESELFDGYSVSELETEKEIEYSDYILNGRLDRISVSAEGGPCIIDYKTGGLPSKADCFPDEDGRLINFQIPVYIKLYEENYGFPVEKAVFLSVIKREKQAVLDGEKHTRDSYQCAIEALESYLDAYVKRISALDFRKDSTPFDV
ncbi:MAG: PD-(D/E)XK nuclease family protein, partial [Spirochaetaceae bacterium]|nr:PD-(D/E)XK nuclease family protein [Spirochaetaceae bacterium]